MIQLRGSLIRIAPAGAVIVGLLLPWLPAAAEIPHEGNYTTKQMAAIVWGYLSAPETRRCNAIAREAESMSSKLETRYGFAIEDFEEDSALGKRYVRMGRSIAAKDARNGDFCDDVKSEIDQAGAELLPH